MYNAAAMKRHFCLLLLILFSHAAVAQDWRTEADARIEQHRKENVTLVVTVDGQPIAGATVDVKMVRHEFLFGSNIFLARRRENQTPQQNADYDQRYVDLFNFATLPFYWPWYDMVDGQPDHTNNERVAQWCKDRGITTKGHPLVWNFGDPAWLRGLPLDEVFRLQMDWATGSVGHFRETINMWDVLNEPTEWDRPDTQSRSSQLTELGNTMGVIELIRASFAAAREANPDATLLINDYYVGEGFAAMLEQLVDDSGKPIYDVIGIQSHMHTAVWDNDRIWEVCERFARFNVPIHFTELTVLSTHEPRDWWGEGLRYQISDAMTTPEGEQMQAEHVERIYTMLFSHPSVEAISWWDFSDLHAWMRAPAGLLRRDMSPKPAYETLHNLINEKWATNVTVQTNDAGIASLRAFRGKYQFTMTLPDGRQKNVAPWQIQKGTGRIVLEWND